MYHPRTMTFLIDNQCDLVYVLRALHNTTLRERQIVRSPIRVDVQRRRPISSQVHSCIPIESLCVCSYIQSSSVAVNLIQFTSLRCITLASAEMLTELSGFIMKITRQNYRVSGIYSGVACHEKRWQTGRVTTLSTRKTTILTLSKNDAFVSREI